MAQQSSTDVKIKQVVTKRRKNKHFFLARDNGQMKCSSKIEIKHLKNSMI